MSFTNRISAFFHHRPQPQRLTWKDLEQAGFTPAQKENIVRTDLDFGEIIWSIKKDTEGRMVVHFQPYTHLTQLHLNAKLNPWPIEYQGLATDSEGKVMINSRGNAIPSYGRADNTVIDYFRSLRSRLEETPMVANTEELVFDFENVYDIDHNAVGFLLSMMQKEGGSNRKVILINVNKRIESQLKYTGLNHVFMPEDKTAV